MILYAYKLIFSDGSVSYRPVNEGTKELDEKIAGAIYQWDNCIEMRIISL